jgi:hypothetical protein
MRAYRAGSITSHASFVVGSLGAHTHKSKSERMPAKRLSAEIQTRTPDHSITQYPLVTSLLGPNSPANSESRNVGPIVFERVLPYL